MPSPSAQAAANWCGNHPAELTLLLAFVCAVWCARHASRSLQIISQPFLIQIEPEFDIDFMNLRLHDSVLTAKLMVMAAYNPAIFWGGLFRLYSCDDERLLDVSLRPWANRKMVVGQAFWVDIEVTLPRDERGKAKPTYYVGYILYSDARSMGHYLMTFSEVWGIDSRRIGRARLAWLRLSSPLRLFAPQPWQPSRVN